LLFTLRPHPPTSPLLPYTTLFRSGLETARRRSISSMNIIISRFLIGIPMSHAIQIIGIPSAVQRSLRTKRFSKFPIQLTDHQRVGIGSRNEERSPSRGS